MSGFQDELNTQTKCDINNCIFLLAEKEILHFQANFCTFNLLPCIYIVYVYLV